MIAICGCSSLIYQPSQPLYMTPDQAGLFYDAVEIESSDGTRLQGWFIPAQKLVPSLTEGLQEGAVSVRTLKAQGTIVHFHGNGENRSTHYGTLVWLIEHGYNLLTFDYRGYGGSGGRADPAGVYRDGMAAIRWAKQNVPRGSAPKDLILYGQSLGGAVLARCFEDVADRSRVRAVVIEGAFHSYQEIAADVLSRFWLTWSLQPLGRAWISDETSPENSFARIAPIPLLVIHAKSDPVIPYRFGREIFLRATEPKTFWEIPRGRHLNTYALEEGRYRRDLVNYLNELPGAQSRMQTEAATGAQTAKSEPTPAE